MLESLFTQYGLVVGPLLVVIVILWRKSEKQQDKLERLEREYREYVIRSHRCLPRKPNGGVP